MGQVLGTRSRSGTPECRTAAATPSWRQRIGRVAVASLIAFAAACSDEPNRAGEDSPRSTTESTAPGTTGTATTFDDRSQEVVDGFLAAGDAFNEAAGGPDPDYPLERTHVGPMLNQSRNIVEGLATDGLVLEYPDDTQMVQVVLAVDFRSDSVAILDTCTVDDGRRVDQETGEVVVGGEVATSLAQVAMELHGDAWKLAEREETDRLAGTQCDSAG